MNEQTRRFKVWLESKEPVAALAAFSITAAYEMGIQVAAALAQTPEVLKKLKFPGPVAWQAMYRDHMTFACYYFELELPHLAKTDRPLVATALRCVARLATATEDERAEFLKEYESLPDDDEEKVAFSRAVMWIVQLQARHALADDPGAVSDHEAKLFEEMNGSGRMRFAMLVWLPCVLLADEHPTKLLRRARAGDHDALRLLVRIDPSIMSEPRIAQRLHEDRHGQPNGYLHTVTRALAAGPLGVNERQIKLRGSAIAAELLRVGEGETIGSVIKLLDISRHAATGGVATRDETFSGDVPDDFARQVRRYRKQLRTSGRFGRADKS